MYIHENKPSVLGQKQKFKASNTMVLTIFWIPKNDISKAKNAFSFYVSFRKHKPKYSKWKKKHNEGHYLGSEPTKSTRRWEEWLATQGKVSLSVSFLLWQWHEPQTLLAARWGGDDGGEMSFQPELWWRRKGLQDKAREGKNDFMF